jgi:spore maturation protein CgeB
VFDIMASPSLLITEHHPNSDLYALFGEDCPVPMYRDFDHLRELCAFYLDNEDERRRVVERCNALVDERFLLRNRLSEMLRLAGISPPTGRQAEPPEIVRARAFHGIARRLGPAARLAARRAAGWMRTR